MVKRLLRVFLVSFLIAMLGLTAAGCSNQRPVVMVTTTSFRDSGLAGALVQVLQKQTGLKISLVAQGSGAAVEMLKRGDADVGITHAPTLEMQLTHLGWHRVPFMQNYFYLVGPKQDPARAKSLTLTEAFRRIYQGKFLFVSRGDQSGTHMMEKALWGLLGLDPDTFGDWYIKTQAGMLTSLQIANEKGAYILTDQSTWLRNRDKLPQLDFITTSTEGLNTYSFLYKDARYAVLSEAFFSKEAQQIIRQFQFEPLER
ncbi:tungsten ABC transporter substrate-binding protein [Coprothermobacteraceae bacterium]|nr:tungsten ABC transporter substrate-binding protein [Coprothermobacteraceae bacterium]